MMVNGIEAFQMAMVRKTFQATFMKEILNKVTNRVKESYATQMAQFFKERSNRTKLTDSENLHPILHPGKASGEMVR